MTENEQREILRKYAEAIRSRYINDPRLPGVTVVHGTLLVRADGTEYHYDGDWVTAETLTRMQEELSRFRLAERNLDIESFDGDMTEQGVKYVRLDDVVAVLVAVANRPIEAHEVYSLQSPSPVDDR